MLQACICSQRFDLAQVRPLSFLSLRISTLWLSLCALCGPHDRLTRSRRGPRSRFYLCLAKKLHIIDTPSMLAHERSTFVSLSSLSSTSTSQVTLPVNKHCADLRNEVCGSVAKTTSSTGHEPNVIDNFDCSETFSAIFQNESVDVDSEPSYSLDAVSLQEKRYLHHCSLRSEKNQRT